MKHIISFSGGLGSYFTLKRVLEKVDKENIELVFCDTLFEDEDLYRFIDDVVEKYQVKLVNLCVGKTPVELSKEEKFLYNSRVASCSKKLKSKPFKEYIKSIDEQIVLYFGIDFTESHRCAAIEKHYKNYKVEFPMCKAPYLFKHEMIWFLDNDEIELPRMYKLGFSHNNCKGRCFKAGIGHFKNLYEKDRCTYLSFEQQEQEIIEAIGKDVGIMKRKGKPFTLKMLRESIESNQQLSLFEENEIGGCGCFFEDD